MQLNTSKHNQNQNTPDLNENWVTFLGFKFARILKVFTNFKSCFNE